jgi:hypothetical protein
MREARYAAVWKEEIMSTVRKILDFSFLRWTVLKHVGLSALLGVLAVLVVPDTGSARVFRVVGPEEFVRSASGPVAEELEFMVEDPGAADFTLHVFYTGIAGDLAGIVPAALVTLNGKKVVTPDEFKQNVAYIRKPIELFNQNTLSVEVRGKPGSGIRVVITGQNDEPRVVYFGDAILPDGRALFGQDLRYLWTIISEPEGGNAVLSDRYSSGPDLSVDRPGEYLLQLTINSDLWESEPFQIKLLATAYPPFVPVPVLTRMVDSSGRPKGIKVGATTYAVQVGTNCGSSATHGFQVLVLDRATMALKENRTFYTPCGNQTMTDFLSSLSNATTYPVAPLVIVSSLEFAPPTEVCGNSSDCPLGRALEGLGGTSIYRSHYGETLSYPVSVPYYIYAYFSYSLIGIPGLGQNQGTELNNWDHRVVASDSERLSSNIEGYFVQDVNHQWTFAYPQFAEIETRAEASDTANTIKVGGFWKLDGSWVPPASYASVPLMPGTLGGFQVLILDGDTLSPAAGLPPGLQPNTTYITNGGSDTITTVSQQMWMRNDLETLLTDTSRRFVVVIASIGQPIDYKDPFNFESLVRTIGNYYGGNMGVLNGLGPTSTYSLVGMNNAGNAPYGLGALNTVESDSPGENLRVVLHKDKQGWNMPAVTAARAAGATDRPDFSLLSVALQPATAWPIPNPNDPLYQEQLAAYQYISSHIGENTYDIRSYYTLSPIDPAAWLSYCNTLQYPATPNPYFSHEVFDSMTEQLCGTNGEFNYVAHVNQFMTDMSTVLINMQISSTANLGRVYESVKATVAPPDQRTVMYDAGVIIRGLLTAGTAIVPDPVLKGAMGVLNGMLSIAQSLSKKPGGADYASINTQASNLGNEMDNLWKSCNSGKDIVLDMIKSDWGKLRYVGNKFMTAQDQGGWKYYDTDRQEWVKVVTNSLESYYFQSLIPAVFKIDYLQNSTIIPAPKNFLYHAGGSWTCNPYCNGSSANPTAYWVDQFTTGSYSWFVLENGITMAKVSGCGYLEYDHSAALRNVLFGTGDWKDNSGNIIGVNLNLSRPVFYERWLPSSVYIPPTMPLFDEVTGYYDDCSG